MAPVEVCSVHLPVALERYQGPLVGRWAVQPLAGLLGSGLGYGLGKGLIALSNMLKGGDQQKQQEAQERHGGGKTGQKQNVERAQSAKDKFEAAKKDFDQLKAKPNKTKVEN